MSSIDTRLLDRFASLVGIELSYLDVFGERQVALPDTKAAILSALGFDVSSVQAMHAAVTGLEEERWRRWVAPVVIKIDESVGVDLDVFLPADAANLSWAWQVACEHGEQGEGTFRPEDLPLRGARDIDGQRVEWRSLRMPNSLPIGYHRLSIGWKTSINAEFVIAPRRCYVPPELRAADGRQWGISTQLYTLRSERNWGIGDFTDLSRLCALAGRLGASLVATNPLHTLFPPPGLLLQVRIHHPAGCSSIQSIST